MRPSERSSFGWRGLALLSGMLCVVGLAVPAAWSTAARDDGSTLGAGLYPAAYAISGAKVVAAPGKVLDPGTIVVRRGVIEAVGLTKDVTVPYDAEIDRRQRAGGLSGLHRPVFDGRSAGGSRAIGDRQGPAR